MTFSTLKYYLLLAVIHQSCITRKPVDPLHYTGNTVILGHGGGFAGTEEEYRLLENGQLYHRALLNEPFKLLKSKTKKRSGKWIAEFDSLSQIHTSFNVPGNTYKFVVFKKDTLENRVVWSSQNREIDHRITQFYERFSDYWIYDKPQN
ncbi:hypothetical protein [Dyadobacter sp. CY312]|uniref:hypothetical protein n=1 Tax=Dyadobacter sp. CY312 TaxID=2907303 RepID=UPI001F28F410|nr:hypothetical protein [Dyadobacter sp. CY312]MCE7043938.1 hypothetical protein [Dyadobacter sp. CY312]